LSQAPTEAGARPHHDGGEFGELLRYTLAGFSGGLLLAGALDWLGLQRSALGQWGVRTLAGEGESLLEGLYAFRKRLGGSAGSMAEAYGFGKLAGMAAPWAIDWATRLVGVDAYGIGAFYVPYFYALGDQIGANLSGLLFLRRRQGSWPSAFSAYARDAVMLTSLLVVLIVPLALAGARLLGFSPTTQLRTAGETIAANLCWLPPLVGWLGERRRRDP